MVRDRFLNAAEARPGHAHAKQLRGGFTARTGAVPVLLPMVLAGVPALAIRLSQLFFQRYDLAEAVHGSAILGKSLDNQVKMLV